MRVWEIGAAAGLTAAASVGLVALSLHKSVAAGPLSRVPAQLVRMQAVLREVDAPHGLLRVGDPLRPMVVRIGEDTTIFARGRIGTVGDLRIGQSICVAYSADGRRDRHVDAEWIEPCAR
ncbi:MAG: hypothetical protein IRZ16_00685 [Myxococcaceae bacterium]|nr:hypothetical protein [Myxococcaceae bacterium]